MDILRKAQFENPYAVTTDFRKMGDKPMNFLGRPPDFFGKLIMFGCEIALAWFNPQLRKCNA